jgi:hypothetical protein
VGADINRFCHQLEYICNTEFPDFDWQRKMDFFFEARHCFGRTALLLSGGAGLGVYHLGVVKALFEQNLLPKVIAGSSVGSLIASIICTRNDVELPELFMPNRLNFEVFDRIEAGSLQRKLHRLRTKGVLQDIKKLEEMLRANVGDVTFKEAYDKTGRILNITGAVPASRPAFYFLPLTLSLPCSGLDGRSRNAPHHELPQLPQRGTYWYLYAVLES